MVKETIAPFLSTVSTGALSSVYTRRYFLSHSFQPPPPPPPWWGGNFLQRQRRPNVNPRTLLIRKNFCPPYDLLFRDGMRGTCISAILVASQYIKTKYPFYHLLSLQLFYWTVLSFSSLQVRLVGHCHYPSSFFCMVQTNALVQSERATEHDNVSSPENTVIILYLLELKANADNILYVARKM